MSLGIMRGGLYGHLVFLSIVKTASSAKGHRRTGSVVPKDPGLPAQRGDHTVSKHYKSSIDGLLDRKTPVNDMFFGRDRGRPVASAIVHGGSGTPVVITSSASGGAGRCG